MSRQEHTDPVIERCPCCAGAVRDFQSQQDGLWYVSCENCGLKTGPVFINDSDEQRRTVIAAWNARAGVSRQGLEVASRDKSEQNKA